MLKIIIGHLDILIKSPESHFFYLSLDYVLQEIMVVDLLYSILFHPETRKDIEKIIGYIVKLVF